MVGFAEAGKSRPVWKSLSTIVPEFVPPISALPSALIAVRMTPREREIITLLRQGLRNKQIAGEMDITEGTVKIYLFRLFHKLGVRNRFELARCGIVRTLSAETASVCDNQRNTTFSSVHR